MKPPTTSERDPYDTAMAIIVFLALAALVYCWDNGKTVMSIYNSLDL